MKEHPFRHLAHVAPFAAEPLVYLTATTFDRRPLLANDLAHALLRETWTRSAEANGWWVGQYVVMPDHVHLFARGGRESDQLSMWMKVWKSVVSHRLVRAAKITAPLWQEDYFDRYLRSSESYSENGRMWRRIPFVRVLLCVRRIGPIEV